MGPAVGLDHLPIDEQRHHEIAGHAGAAVSVHGERAEDDVVFDQSIGNQLLVKLRGFTHGDCPADDVAAEYVEDYAQVIAAPFDRAFRFGGIPSPNFLSCTASSSGLA